MTPPTLAAAPVAFLGVALLCVGCGRGPPPPVLLYEPVSLNGEPLGMPSRNEAAFRAAIEGWVARVDGDGDGRLTVAEVRADADRQFALLDLDKDGSITSAELTQVRIQSPFQLPARRPTSRLRPRTDLAAADVDPGGPTPSGGGRRQAEIRSNVDPVMSADTNADFRVTLLEFHQQAADRVAEFDRTGDNAVTADEIVEGQLDAFTLARAQSRDRQRL